MSSPASRRKAPSSLVSRGGLRSSSRLRVSSPLLSNSRYAFPRRASIPSKRHSVTFPQASFANKLVRSRICSASLETCLGPCSLGVSFALVAICLVSKALRRRAVLVPWSLSLSSKGGLGSPPRNSCFSPQFVLGLRLQFFQRFPQSILVEGVLLHLPLPKWDLVEKLYVPGFDQSFSVTRISHGDIGGLCCSAGPVVPSVWV